MVLPRTLSAHNVHREVDGAVPDVERLRNAGELEWVRGLTLGGPSLRKPSGPSIVIEVATIPSGTGSS